MRTAKEQSPTKDKLIRSTVKLMRAKGYEATSVDDICCECNVTKGSFFHHFKDKETVAKAALDCFVIGQHEEMLKNAAKSEKDPLKRLNGLIDRIIEMSRNPDTVNGCLIGAFSQELSDTNPSIRQACASKFDAFTAMLKGELDAVKARYKPKTAMDTESLAQHFIAIMQGSMVMTKAKRDTRILERNVKHFKQYLNGLFSKASSGQAR